MVKVLATVGLSLIFAATATTAPPAAKPSSDASKQTYCLTFADDTGSHINRTECRTKKEWKQLGVDVDQLSSKTGAPEGTA